MNKEWSLLLKESIKGLNKKDFKEAISKVLILRNTLMKQLLSFSAELTTNEFSEMPFIDHDGFENKTIAYAVFHLARIEDIVLNTLIRNENQIFFSENYQQRINSPIITTGNELMKEEIRDFSQKLNIRALFEYMIQVKDATDKWLLTIDYSSLKTKIDKSNKEKLLLMKVVDNSNRSIWLIDYWCNKDIKGLIKMPFTRH